MDFSIIIPAYEESAKISRDILAASEFFVENNLKGEILVVDDGSRDQTASVSRSQKVSATVCLKVISYQHHRGKGYAIRHGIKASEGEFVMFADSGLCVPYFYALRGLDLIKQGKSEIAHGSRKLPDSHIVLPQSFSRRISAKIFRWIAIGIIKIPRHLTDTQCGFKIYKGDIARDLYGKAFTDGFMIDLEIIFRACKKNYRILEFPIQWTADRDSRLSLPRVPLKVIKELFKIKKRLKAEN
jgi:dolichyl-phosphate beta-glucosyltransferase